MQRLLVWVAGICLVLLIVFWPSDFSGFPILTHPDPSKNQNQNPQLKAQQPPSPPYPPPSKPNLHSYRQDGLLEVNPKGKHPIYELIERAEIQWKRKIQKQSKTFEDAVKEYKRRYKRRPPKGFDLWWDYADYYSIQLPDEYDSINKMLSPLWAIRPQTLQRLQRDAESQFDSFTIGKVRRGSESEEDSKVELLNHTFAKGGHGHSRLKHILDMLDEVQQWLPEFRATFNIHDTPRVQVSWEARQAAERAAEKGEYVDTSKIRSPAQGWSAVCPPDSLLRSLTPLPFTGGDPPAQEIPSSYQAHLPRGKTFIYNHPSTMSPCHHPHLLLLSGALSNFHKSVQFGPSPWPELTPVFSMSSTFLNFDILHPAAEGWMDAEELSRGFGGEDKVPTWDDMFDDRLLWRGSTTGSYYSSENPWWNMSQRIRLVEMATRRGGETRVLIPHLVPDAPVGFGHTLKYNTLNTAFMDVAFVGQPHQCEKKLCDAISNMFEFRKRMPLPEAGGYKYILDIDGNGWSSRFKRLLSSNSLILKATIFPEWYTERIMPWVHYVPVQYTLSDIYDILAFFRGSPLSNLADIDDEPDILLDADRMDGFRGNEHLARKIASAGREWSETMFRKEDMVAYMYRLLLEYARVMSLDREAMTMQV